MSHCTCPYYGSADARPSTKHGRCVHCGLPLLPAPSRLTLAMAALEECRARFNEHTGKAQRAYNEETALIAEVHAAEREAAIRAIPPALLEVARKTCGVQMSPRTPPPFVIRKAGMYRCADGTILSLVVSQYPNEPDACWWAASPHNRLYGNDGQRRKGYRDEPGDRIIAKVPGKSPTVSHVAGAPAKGKRRYSITHYADGWACRGLDREVVAICMSRADARKFAQMKNAEGK